MYSLEQYKQAIDNTPRSWQGLPLQAKKKSAFCVSRRTDPETKKMWTMYNTIEDNKEVFFVVADGKIL